MNSPIIQMKGISKEFSGVWALKDVHLNIYKGKVMALLGENGAGKSTLMKILTGVYSKTAGDIYFEERLVSINNIKDSQTLGIAIIHQELNLIKNLSIAENIFLGREPVRGFRKIDWKKLFSDAEKIMARIGMKENPWTLVKDLSIGKQQMVEIAKALSMDAKVIVMDEPTGALTEKETENLFKVIDELKAEGRSIVYISHRLKEIFQVCDDITVLRDGHFIREHKINEVDEDKIIELMVGRKLSEQFPRVNCNIGEKILEVRNLNNEFVREINLEVRKGEIVGIAGLMGSGRTELARTLYGIYKKDSGQILVEGKTVSINTPAQAIQNGIAYVSEDRKANGVVLDLNLKENVTLSILSSLSKFAGKIDSKREESIAHESMRNYAIKASNSTQLVKNLSGGNQQKVSLAKSLVTNPKILILDEPTRGVDVGAKKEIYDIINRFKQDGMGIIMISSEIPEILGISDRILVMHEGTVAGCLEREEANQENIMRLAVGSKGVEQ